MEAVAGVGDLFNLEVWVEGLKFSCRFEGDDGGRVAYDEEDGGADGAYQVSIVGVWRDKVTPFRYSVVLVAKRCSNSVTKSSKLIKECGTRIR